MRSRWPVGAAPSICCDIDSTWRLFAWLRQKDSKTNPRFSLSISGLSSIPFLLSFFAFFSLPISCPFISPSLSSFLPPSFFLFLFLFLVLLPAIYGILKRPHVDRRHCYVFNPSAAFAQGRFRHSQTLILGRHFRASTGRGTGDTDCSVTESRVVSSVGFEKKIWITQMVQKQIDWCLRRSFTCDNIVNLKVLICFVSLYRKPFTPLDWRCWSKTFKPWTRKASLTTIILTSKGIVFSLM